MADPGPNQVGHEPDLLAGAVVGLLGGTGAQGRGLARRFALSGIEVVLGSRSAQRAATAAAELTAEGVGAVRAASNEQAARAATIAVVAVPWDGHAALLSELRSDLAGTLVVDCVNPVGFDQHGAYALDVPEGSAAEQAAALLPDSTVVAAFHHVSAVVLLDPMVDTVDLDVLVLGDDRRATDTVVELASRVPGMRGVYGGRLRNARQVEALTANLISINRRYRAHAGLRVTDV